MYSSPLKIKEALLCLACSWSDKLLICGTWLQDVNGLQATKPHRAAGTLVLIREVLQSSCEKDGWFDTENSSPDGGDTVLWWYGARGVIGRAEAAVQVDGIRIILSERHLMC